MHLVSAERKFLMLQVSDAAKDRGHGDFQICQRYATIALGYRAARLKNERDKERVIGRFQAGICEELRKKQRSNL